MASIRNSTDPTYFQQGSQGRRRHYRQGTSSGTWPTRGRQRRMPPWWVRRDPIGETCMRPLATRQHSLLSTVHWHLLHQQSWSWFRTCRGCRIRSKLEYVSMKIGKEWRYVVSYMFENNELSSCCFFIGLVVVWSTHAAECLGTRSIDFQIDREKEPSVDRSQVSKPVHHPRRLSSDNARLEDTCVSWNRLSWRSMFEDKSGPSIMALQWQCETQSSIGESSYLDNIDGVNHCDS